MSCLSATDLYRYLAQEHDATTVGVLLGMAAAKRGTLDSTVSRMLLLHVPSRLPASCPELELSPTVQSAALLGTGLLYQESCHRCACTGAVAFMPASQLLLVPGVCGRSELGQITCVQQVTQ